MVEDRKDEPTQRTEKGLEIPIPTRDDFMRTVEKAARPTKQRPDPQDEDRASGSSEGSDD
jgi:hypothetical protein